MAIAWPATFAQQPSEILEHGASGIVLKVS
jgi:hypothetical protein